MLPGCSPPQLQDMGSLGPAQDAEGRNQNPHEETQLRVDQGGGCHGDQPDEGVNTIDTPHAGNVFELS